MAPLVSYMSEYVTSRAPEYVKHRIKSDLYRRVVQVVVSSEMFNGHKFHDSHLKYITEFNAGDAGNIPQLKANKPTQVEGFFLQQEQTLQASQAQPQSQPRARAPRAAAPEPLYVEVDSAGAPYRAPGRNFVLHPAPTMVDAAGRRSPLPHAHPAAGGSFLDLGDGPAEPAAGGAAAGGGGAQAQAKPGVAKVIIADRTHMRPDGCLTLPLVNYLIKSLTNVVPVSSMERIVNESHELIAGLIAPSLLDFVTPELQKAIPRAVFPMTTTIVQQTVPVIVKRLAPASIIKYSAAALTDTLVRGVAHVVVPTLSHTLSDASKTEPLCYYCHYVDPRYCYLCPKNRPVPKSSQMSLHLYTIDQFVDYYTDYYADVFRGDTPLTSKRPDTQFPL
jgi:hypothetical protein